MTKEIFYVKTALPLIGDPIVYPTQPCIVVPNKRVGVFYKKEASFTNEKISKIVKKIFEKAGKEIMFFDFIKPQINLFEFQQLALWCAAALGIAYGRGKSASVFANDMRSILGKEYTKIFPLAYAGYTGFSVAFKGFEDPVVIYKKGLSILKAQTADFGAFKQNKLDSYVNDVIAHSVGRLTVRCSEFLRKRMTKSLAECLNIFGCLVQASSGDPAFLSLLQEHSLKLYNDGALGCAYIPSWRIFVWL
ncbi:hypothetical protein B9Q02_00890 [Candidatus Marsarchaeota G1 archaeon BE_D]|jgi:hypothetical protein|uniref:Uncharacterized protein n=1 Tax=Candidatus Marsarchaeota G1 archaeon BE_D TaxID=1978156 RepID=A0A2R6AK54_9ARCH|nr:MAG: hypothetical protein B9Q02_00890 [Candidatus Marsarchaeota G1 archaeon BE_D]